MGGAILLAILERAVESRLISTATSSPLRLRETGRSSMFWSRHVSPECTLADPDHAHPEMHFQDCRADLLRAGAACLAKFLEGGGFSSSPF